jgi:phage tail tape-measure protein
MSKKTVSLLLVVSLLSSSCSSTRKSLALGLAAGAGTGAAMGAAFSSNHSKGAVTGLAVGALVGGIASYFIDKGLQARDQDTRRDTLFNLEKHGVFGSRPAVRQKQGVPYGVTPAVVDEQFVDTHVEDGTRLVEGHKVWTIQEGSQWTREIPDRGADHR